MKKTISLIILFITLIFTCSCYYKELDSNDEIIISDNPTLSILFHTNEYGYSEDNKFIVQIKDKNDTSIYFGKPYQGTNNYKKIVENKNCKLLNYVNDYIFLQDEHGLQSLEFDNESLINDISCNYLIDGFDQTVINEGVSEYINLFQSSQLINGIDNKNILFSGNLSSKTSNTLDTRTYLSQVIIYKDLDGIYLYNDSTNKIIDSKTKNETIELSKTTSKISDNLDILKVLSYNIEGEIYVVILKNNNEIISINVNNNDIKTIEIPGIIDTFNKVDDKFYLITNNVLYIFNLDLTNEQRYSYDGLIAGSTWFKERQKSYVKLAVLQNKHDIIFKLIEIDNNETGLEE